MLPIVLCVVAFALSALAVINFFRGRSTASVAIPGILGLACHAIAAWIMFGQMVVVWAVLVVSLIGWVIIVFADDFWGQFPRVPAWMTTVTQGVGAIVILLAIVATFYKAYNMYESSIPEAPTTEKPVIVAIPPTDLPSPTPTYYVAFTSTPQPAQPTVASTIPPTNTPIPAPTEMPATVVPADVASSPDPSSCNSATIKSDQTHGGKVEADLNDGDPFDWSLTVINPDMPTSTDTVVVLTEKGYIFDVVYPVMYFTSFRIQGSQSQAICTALEMGGDNATYLYAGKQTRPDGFFPVSDTSGWWTSMEQKQYDGDALTPGGEWKTFQIASDDKDRDIESGSLTYYGQLWKSSVPGVVVHFQIEPSKILSIPTGWQGTYYSVTGADPTILQERFIEASKEVVIRDKIKSGNITLFYCGKTVTENKLTIDDPSTNWVTDLLNGNSVSWTDSLEGWTCK